MVALAVVVAHTVVVHTLWTPYALRLTPPDGLQPVFLSHGARRVETMHFSTISWVIFDGILTRCCLSYWRFLMSSTRCENLSRAFVLPFLNPQKCRQFHIISLITSISKYPSKETSKEGTLAVFLGCGFPFSTALFLLVSTNTHATVSPPFSFCCSRRYAHRRSFRFLPFSF